MTIVRWDPFRDFGFTAGRTWVPPVDIYQTGDHELVLTAELPDMTREAIDVTVENFVLTRESPLSRAESQFLLEGIAQNLGAGLLRVKGLINIAEEPGRPAVIQGAQHLLHTMTWLDRWPDDDHRTRVVFITQGIARESLRDIIDLLDRVSSRTFKARARGQQAQEAAKSTTQTQ